MSNAPLMPMATAVWLVENTTLTFKQIANFCKLHEVEIQGIADGEVAKGVFPFLIMMIFTVFIMYIWTDLALYIPFKL